jgi:hypothetical protein
MSPNVHISLEHLSDEAREQLIERLSYCYGRSGPWRSPAARIRRPIRALEIARGEDQEANRDLRLWRRFGSRPKDVGP